MSSIGVMAMVSILSHILFIYIAWVAIQSIHIDKFIKKHRVMEARLLVICLAIIIGSLVSRFFLDILQWSQDLIYLF